MSPVLVVRLSLQGRGHRPWVGGLSQPRRLALEFGTIRERDRVIADREHRVNPYSLEVVKFHHKTWLAEEDLCFEALLLSKLFCLAEKGRSRKRRLSKWRGGGSLEREIHLERWINRRGPSPRS